MLIKTTLLFSLFASCLYSQNILQNEYFINHDFVMLSDIIPNAKTDDKKLFSLEKDRHILRVKSKKLIQLLKKNGYKEYISKHRGYIQFTKQSPINRSKIIAQIKKLYKTKYSSITIQNISVEPNVYMEQLPSSYTVHFQENSYLSRKGMLYIKTPKRREIFFHYLISAKVTIYQAKNSIKRGVQIDNRNCQKNSIMLDRFWAMPIQDINRHQYQSKYNISAGRVITVRNVKPLDFIRRGSVVNIFMDEANMQITFSAKALQNGKLGDTINVRNRDGKKIAVVVTGKNRAEIK